MEEVRLWNNARERENIDNLSDLYAIIVTTEALEKAYFRDNVNASDYTSQASKLIQQFKTLQAALNIPDVQQFMNKYNVNK